ncbi:hypothetical protein Agabi119p4_1877 [Agaricus bisporus var. burnettii]|uniref:Very-long-chain (3R)-3-hydroxyacyl-CoA dehydratase n=1 Tax=Agaricus bisporus var. burnettii TaxID=192524 RepID=A0A8H7F809_AGABI|nr:hypothetical protein Agabi119p4_1877 [Agaricus bisporus var. burnettii]
MSSKATNTKRPKGPSTAVKTYLIAYNFLSTIGWAYLLVSVLIHLFNLDGKSDTYTLSNDDTSRPLDANCLSHFSPSLAAVIHRLYQRAQTTYLRVGTQTAFVQSFAILEVLHVMLGWVRSSLPTTASQVASRLFLVWGVTVPVVKTRSYPAYATMVLAWSSAEVIRYSFYTFTLSGFNVYALLWLRYTMFYVLYPLGVASESSLIFLSLPHSPELGWLRGSWNFIDYFRASQFLIWWPALYVLYTYMIGQRRKVLGPNPKVKKN